MVVCGGGEGHVGRSEREGLQSNPRKLVGVIDIDYLHRGDGFPGVHINQNLTNCPL